MKVHILGVIKHLRDVKTLVDMRSLQLQNEENKMPKLVKRNDIKSLMCVDVGFSNMGVTIYTNEGLTFCDVINSEKSARKTTRVSDDNARRVALLAKGLRDLCELHSVVGICAEAPSGSQNARALAHMSMALAVVSVSAFFLGLPVEYYSAMEVKVALTGNKKASKQEMMVAAAQKFGFCIDTKTIKIGKGKRSGKTSVQQSFSFNGQRYSAAAFEHIADSIGVWFAAQHNNLVRMVK